MTDRRKFKRRVRERQEQTNETYMQAAAAVQAQRDAPPASSSGGGPAGSGDGRSSQAKINVVFRLNEKGRKKSLLSGGDGKEIQIVGVPISAELMEWATVRPDGTAWIYAGCTVRDSDEAEGRCPPTIGLSGIPVAGYVAGDWHPGGTRPMDIKALDATPEDVVAWVKNLRAQGEARRAEAVAAETKLKAEKEAKIRRLVAKFVNGEGRCFHRVGRFLIEIDDDFVEFAETYDLDLYDVIEKEVVRRRAASENSGSVAVHSK